MPFLEAMKSHFLTFAPKVAVGLVTFLIFWLTASIAHRIVRTIAEKTKIQSNAVTLVGRLVYWLMLVIGAVFALGFSGVNVGSLIAGFGLAGLALGVALQATVANMFSGALIMCYQPFVQGDRIRVQNNEGNVAEINLRYTLLREGTSSIFVPNSSFFTNPFVVLQKG
ncbi:MAG: mechanosensitive ion channel [Candidatus Omnitrophica bacterium]|nr:mechanosensitive ion channel [Candidatus Omnitrophota bacterium]